MTSGHQTLRSTEHSIDRNTLVHLKMRGFTSKCVIDLKGQILVIGHGFFGAAGAEAFATSPLAAWKPPWSASFWHM
jgi:hypothetical protein